MFSWKICRDIKSLDFAFYSVSIRRDVGASTFQHQVWFCPSKVGGHELQATTGTEYNREQSPERLKLTDSCNYCILVSSREILDRKAEDNFKIRARGSKYIDNLKKNAKIV